MAPKLMKTLAVVGTAAMFLVGGGILVHGIPMLEHAMHGLVEAARGLGALGRFAGIMVSIIGNGVVGLVAGGLLVGAHEMFEKVRPQQPENSEKPE